ncbi:hypothetical protein LAZ40_02255 [Cereibacter sphaeroides]|uniref:hypothetical protein n=1 Tax=Cereibacter sphaeroides TaxID=1063 RepID=UPI001F3943FE|nr:hypothetical protein [Cereibacter sphaeroides]MCE6957880.1 hypothetical protein [Cereibacter sphaeroides]MCE6971849.1 hypothetical protein [Cereibacter sphaeroides]
MALADLDPAEQRIINAILEQVAFLDITETPRVTVRTDNRMVWSGPLNTEKIEAAIGGGVRTSFAVTLPHAPTALVTLTHGRGAEAITGMAGNRILADFLCRDVPKPDDARTVADLLAKLAEVSADRCEDPRGLLYRLAREARDALDQGQPEKIAVPLNAFNREGSVIGRTTAELTLPQIADIVDHAAQLVLVRRAGEETNQVLDELEEALTAADVIEDPDATAPAIP